MSYVIRVAEQRDVEAVMCLLTEAIGWLADRRLDQWQGNRERQYRHVCTDIGEGSVFVVERDGCVVATITLDEFADTDFYTEHDHVHDALFAHRMAVARSAAGIGLGAAMLDWAAGRVQQYGRGWLRLDAWATNGRLHVYYKDVGFEKVRTAYVEGRGSGALFRRPATARDGRGPLLVENLDVVRGALASPRAPHPAAAAHG